MLVVNALAAYRITRLLQKDSFPPAESLREEVEKRGGVLAELWECPWCLGFWASVAAVLAGRTCTGRLLNEALAASTVVGVLSHFVNKMEEDGWA